MSVEKLLARRSMIADPVGDLTKKVAQISASRNLSDKQIGQLVMAQESFNDQQETLITNTYSNMETLLKQVASDMNFAVEEYQVEAATIGGLMATDPAAVLAATPRVPSSDSVIVNLGLQDTVTKRFAVEAYDERENRNAQMYSVVYNLLASRQDEVGETLFPTVIVSPNEVGVTLALKLFYVYNDFKRQTSGALANYNRRNVIRAYADLDILKNELTRLVPVLRAGGSDDNTDKFVDVADVPAWSESLGTGVSVTTGAYKVDTKIDFIGISQTNELLSSGIMGPTDSLDTFMKLDKIFVKSTEGSVVDVIAIDVSNIPSAVFTYAPQGNYRRMILTMDTDAVVLGANTTKINGAALDTLAELATNKARVQLTINGSVVLDKGEGSVSRGALSLMALRNNSGQLVTGATFNTVAGKIAALEVLGFTLQGYRANSNLRQRGQLVDTQTEYRVIPLNYRSPLGILAPAARASSDDTSALQTLITITGIRTSNEAVNTLIRFDVAMDSYQAVADASGSMPEMAQVGHLFVQPTYMKDALDLSATVDSVKSHERFADIRAAIVEKIRYMANEMYRRSEYQAASSVLMGNVGFKPTVIIATDPVIHNYLCMDGDLRTLGDSFDVKVVSSLAEPLKGKIFVTFGVFDQSRNTTVNPLNFGNMLYSPELVLNLPVSRDGQVSNELTVTPRFAHIVNAPILGKLTVSNLPAVTNKVTLNMHSVP